MDHAAVMNSYDAKARRDGFAALSEVERTVWLVSWLNFGVGLGGMSNSRGIDVVDFAAETVAALGRPAPAGRLKRCAAPMPHSPGGSPQGTQEERGDTWRSLARGDHPLGALE